MTHLRAVVGLIGLALAADPSAADAGVPSATRIPPSPSEFRAVRLDGASVRLDGIPDEPVWQHAAFITGLTSYDPGEGGPPVGQMNAWVFYDSEALYVAARLCYQRGDARSSRSARAMEQR